MKRNSQSKQQKGSSDKELLLSLFYNVKYYKSLFLNVPLHVLMTHILNTHVTCNIVPLKLNTYLIF